MSERKHLERLTRLLAGRDCRSYDDGPTRLVVERLREGPLISLCRFHEEKGRSLRAPQVVFLVDGDRAKPIFFRTDHTGAEFSTAAGYRGRDVPVQASLQPELDRFVGRLWRGIKSKGYFQMADGALKVDTLKLGKVYFGKVARGIDQLRPREASEAMSEQTAGKTDVYTKVTDHILKAMESGPGEWRAPWHVDASAAIPVNAATNLPYRGVNVLTLWVAAQERGYESNRWATYRQWREELGAQVRRGAKGSPVVFWKELGKDGAEEEREEESEGKKRIVAKAYTVFNAAEVDGYEAPKPKELPEGERHAEADRYFFGLGADIRHGGGSASYHPQHDFIRVPELSAFRTQTDYYSTLAHELTHWTGHKDRLNRDLSGRFGKAAYAAEELVAEFGAAFQMARLGLASEPRPDHAAYIAHWYELLKSDKKAVFHAAGKAQLAVDYLERRHEEALLSNREMPGMEHTGPPALEPSSLEAMEALGRATAEAPEHLEAGRREGGTSGPTQTIPTKDQVSHFAPPGAAAHASEEISPVDFVRLRAGKGEGVLSGYKGGSVEARITDCLADLMHLSKDKGVSFKEALRKAHKYYTAERAELGEDLGRSREEAKASEHRR